MILYTLGRPIIRDVSAEERPHSVPHRLDIFLSYLLSRDLDLDLLRLLSRDRDLDRDLECRSLRLLLQCQVFRSFCEISQVWVVQKVFTLPFVDV